MYDAGNIAPDDEDIVYEYNSDNTLKRILQKYEKDGEIKYRRLVRSAYDVRGNVTAIKTKNGYYQNVTYDAKNRLKKAEGDYSEYWYDADDNRIDMYDHSTNMKYTYDFAGGRSRLVWTSSHLYEVTTYAYGAEGLIWSRTDGSYQVYHYDYRGSVIAVTDIDGNITDTITYTAYGKQASRTGTSKLIFGYNGRHGVLSDPNGLLYMRTRFYNPDFKRFMSADIIDGSIADSTSLNVYAFVNGNPISLIDPFGLSSRGGEDSSSTKKPYGFEIGFNFAPSYLDYMGWGNDFREIGTRTYNYAKYGFNVNKFGQYAIIKGAHTSAALNQGIQGTRYAFKNAKSYDNVFSYIKPSAALNNTFSVRNSIGGINYSGVFTYAAIAMDVGVGIYDNIQNDTPTQRIVSDAVVDTTFDVGSIVATTAVGAAVGSVVPGIGNVVGSIAVFFVGGIIYIVTDVVTINDNSIRGWAKEGAGYVADAVVGE